MTATPRRLRVTIDITPRWWQDTKDNLELFVLTLAWCVDNVPSVASVKASRMKLEVETLVSPEMPVEMLALAALENRLVDQLANMGTRVPGMSARPGVKAGHVEQMIRTMLSDKVLW